MVRPFCPVLGVPWGRTWAHVAYGTFHFGVASILVTVNFKLNQQAINPHPQQNFFSETELPFLLTMGLNTHVGFTLHGKWYVGIPE